jgi:hypothetical protein
MPVRSAFGDPSGMRRVAYRIVFAATYAVGRVQAWLAQGIREGATVERVLIFPSWLVFRVAFQAGYVLTLAVAGVKPGGTR